MTHICQETRPSLFHMMASRLFGAKLLSEPTLTYCTLGPIRQKTKYELLFKEMKYQLLFKEMELKPGRHNFKEYWTLHQIVPVIAI